MQERKFGSAFRLSGRQFDSLKTKNSLGQLLGAQSGKRIDDYPKVLDSDIDAPASQSTSTMIRCGAGSRNSSKENIPVNNLGLKGTNASFLTADFNEKLFGHQMGLFGKLKTTTEDMALPKKTQTQSDERTALLFVDPKVMGLNSATKLDKSLELIYNILTGFTKQQPAVYNPPFTVEALKDESNKHQQAFFSKIEQLRNLEQQLTLTQTSENRFGSRKPATMPNMKVENSPTDETQNTRVRFPEISSLNSLDEEVDMNTKPSNQFTGLSINQLDFSPSKAKSDLSLTTKLSEDYRPCSTQSIQDFSNANLQQRIELHHVKNRKCKVSYDEVSDGKGNSKTAPGTYPPDERIRKILSYKKKIVKWRMAHPPNRSFSGRSAVAGSKPRIKGKFVKKDEYHKYMEEQKSVC